MAMPVVQPGGYRLREKRLYLSAQVVESLWACLFDTKAPVDTFDAEGCTTAGSVNPEAHGVSRIMATCAWLIPDQILGAALAVGISIALLLTFRCLHPPSGAVALTAVVGGPAIDQLGYGFVVWPVLFGSLGLLISAVLYHRLTGKAYPHLHHAPPAVESGRTAGGLGLTARDLAAAIRERDEILPVDPEDLEDVLHRAELMAFARRSGGVVAAAIMSQGGASVSPTTLLRVVLRLMRSTGAKALPVVDENRRVVGIVTQTDILDKAVWGPSATSSGLGWRLRSNTNSDRPLRGKTRDVMTCEVRCVLTSTPIARVVQVMAETGHHHVPSRTPGGRW